MLSPSHLHDSVADEDAAPYLAKEVHCILDKQLGRCIRLAGYACSHVCTWLCLALAYHG